MQVFAQQWLPTTQGLWMPGLLYAAGAGQTGESKITGVARQQWQSLPGAPTAQWLQWQSASPWWLGGLAAGVSNQELGVHRVTRADLMLNTRLFSNRRLTCTVGGAVGVEQWVWDGSKMRTPDGIYEPGVTAHADPLLTETRVTGLAPAFQLSATIKTGAWQTWVSVQNPATRLVSYEQQRQAPTDAVPVFRGQVMRTWLREKWEIRATTGISLTLHNFQLENGCFFQYNNNILGGVSFRGYTSNTQDAISLLVGWVPGKRTRLMYSFDWATSGIRRVTDGSHELSVVYVLREQAKQPRLPNRIFNPRHL